MTQEIAIIPSSILTEKQLFDLKACFENGATDEEACAWSNVSLEDLHAHQEADPEFLKQKKNIRLKLNLRAKSILVAAMNVDKTGDVRMALKFLELQRKDNENKNNNKRNNQKWKWKI